MGDLDWGGRVFAVPRAMGLRVFCENVGDRDVAAGVLGLLFLGARYGREGTLHHRLGVFLLILRVKLLLMFLLYHLLLLMALELRRRPHLSRVVDLRWWLVVREERQGGIGREAVIAVGHAKVGHRLTQHCLFIWWGGGVGRFGNLSDYAIGDW